MVDLLELYDDARTSKL